MKTYMPLLFSWIFVFLIAGAAAASGSSSSRSQQKSGLVPLTLRNNDQVEGSGGHGISGLGGGTGDDPDDDTEEPIEPFSNQVEGSGVRPPPIDMSRSGGIGLNTLDRENDRDGSGWTTMFETTPHGRSGTQVFSTPGPEIPNTVTDEPLDDLDEIPDGGGQNTIVQKQPNSNTSLLAQPAMLAAVIGGAVVGLLCAILLVMYLLYRMRKKDEGSYALEEPTKRPGGYMRAPTNSSKEYYA